jgi:hypothetical protein
MQRRILHSVLFGLLGLLALGGCDRAATKPAKDQAPATTEVEAVLSVGTTVRDLDRSVEFSSRVLSFEKVSDVEVAGTEYERLTGVFGIRMRVVRMKLGEEFLDLTEYRRPAAARCRPIAGPTTSGTGRSGCTRPRQTRWWAQFEPAPAGSFRRALSP